MFSLSLHGVLEGEVNEEIIGQQVCVYVCVSLCEGEEASEKMYF